MFSKMSRNIYFSMWLFCLCLMTACTSTQEETMTKISQQVSQALQETVAAHPTLLAQPTLTPRPTLTPEATYTAQPSYTPQNTPTNLPTYTPAPTLTPLPTATFIPTAASTNTPLPRPVATAQPTVNVAAALLQEVNITIAQIESFRSNIPPVCPFNAPLSACNHVVDCPSMVSQYDSITAPLTLSVTGSSQDVQNAYAGYQNGLIVFGDNMRNWISTCREAISSGTTVTSDWTNRNSLHAEVNEALDVLYPVKQSLDNLQ